jgi:type I restriction enzyme S subunit
MNEIAMGSFLSQVKNEVQLEDNVTYETVGVLSYGRGLFERPPVKGKDTSYKSYFRIDVGQFVYSKLFAWEGAVAVVPSNLGGRFVSQEFPTFDIDRRRALPEYVSLLCQWKVLWSQLRQGETGMGGRRKRVHPSYVESVRVPLPSLRNQHRIVDLLESNDALVTAAVAVGARAQRVLSSLSTDLLGASEPRPLADFCSIEAPLVDPRLPAYCDLPHLGIESIESGTGRLLNYRTAADDQVISAKFLFTPEDVIFAKIRPELRKVCFPRFVGLCSADAYPLRPLVGVVPEYLFEALQYAPFVAEAVATSGRTKMPKINRTELFALPFPWLPEERQHEVAQLLGAVRAVRDAAVDVAIGGRRLKDNVLSDLVSGGHEISETYDVLLEAS